MGSFSIWHWMLFGAIALLLFGGKGKISDIMGDVAKGIKSFKKGMSEDDEKPEAAGGNSRAREPLGEPGRRQGPREGRLKTPLSSRPIRPEIGSLPGCVSMFDFDVSKLLVFGIIALVVIPPKDLPRVMRTVGQYVGKMRRMAAEFQGQFREAMREADLESVKKEIELHRRRRQDRLHLRSGHGDAHRNDPRDRATEGRRDGDRDRDDAAAAGGCGNVTRPRGC